MINKKQFVVLQVVDKLQQKFGNALYRSENVMISGTHTHSGVAGFHQYVLYLITSLGYVRETYDNLVHGIVKVHVNIQQSLEYGPLFS